MIKLDQPFSPIMLFVVFALILAGCKDEQKVVDTPPPVRPVKLATLKAPEDSRLQSFPGKIQPNKYASLSFRVAGQLDKLPLREGVEVEEGQLLGRLDQRDALNQVKNTEANFELSKANFARIKSLHKRKLVSQSEYDTAQAQLKSTEAALSIARDNLDYTTIHAPFSGVVASMSVENFQYVTAQQEVLVLQALETLDVSIQVPEEIMARVRRENVPEDYRPLLSFPAYPGKSFPVTYKEHKSSISEGTQAYEVIFTLQQPDDLTVLPGMSAEVMLDMAILSGRRKSFLIVPHQAVMTRDSNGKSVVWRYDANSKTMSPVEVQLGEVRKSGIEVIGTLKPGDQLAVAGLASLKEGMKVKPLRWERGM